MNRRPENVKKDDNNDNPEELDTEPNNEGININNMHKRERNMFLDL